MINLSDSVEEEQHPIHKSVGGAVLLLYHVDAEDAACCVVVHTL